MTEHRIVDLGEAAVLMTYGFPMIKLEQSRRAARKIFIFSGFSRSYADNADDLLKRYRSKELTVEPYGLILNYKELKSQIHNQNEAAS